MIGLLVDVRNRKRDNRILRPHNFVGVNRGCQDRSFPNRRPWSGTDSIRHRHIVIQLFLVVSTFWPSCGLDLLAGSLAFIHAHLQSGRLGISFTCSALKITGLGRPMSLPSLASYPPAQVRKDLGPDEWEACLDAWLSLSALYLRLGKSEFEHAARNEQSLVPFLTSYYQVSAQERQQHGQTQGKEHTLRKTCFILTHRTLLTTSHPPAPLLQWDFLSDFSHVYMKTQSLDLLLQKLWRSRHDDLDRSLQNFLSTTIKQLESSKPDVAEPSVKRIVPLLFSSHEAGAIVLTSSELVDAMAAAYPRSSVELHKSLVSVLYYGLLSLTKGDKPNYSLLFDHLYGLKSQATGSEVSILADLVTNTSLLSKLRTTIPGKNSERAQGLANTLSSLLSPSIARPKKTRKVNKGKGKAATDEFGHGAVSDDQRVHQVGFISQIQDLFPDLGSKFIARLWDYYHDDPEQVIACLLDDSVPDHLRAFDRTEEMVYTKTDTQETEQKKIDHLAPRSTPPPERRNVFDNDEFDRLEVDASRLHLGRKNAKLTADALLEDRSNAPAKSAILAALAAFDSDDDERDDTYDEADVGGTVDAARPDGEESRDTDLGNQGENEEALFRAWRMDRAVFERSSDVRRSSARAALKSETGMQDEAIEGWAVMLSRDPRRLKRLEARYSAFSGAQPELERTSYRDSEATEDSDNGGGGRGGRGGGRGRGRGGRGRGRGGRGGGNPAGPPSEGQTQAARQRKEARGSNRRDGRARKMARAGFPG
jgi:activating signal cointegrator complex subunit 2